MTECVAEGILQGYFDGELAPEMMKSVATHLAGCARCAAEARAVESETEMLVAAFEPEMALSVPTARLRARIDEAIANLEVQSYAEPQRRPAASRLRAWFGSLAGSLSLAPRYAVGYASIIAVAAFALIFALIGTQQGRLQVAGNNNSTADNLRFSIPQDSSPVELSGSDDRTTATVSGTQKPKHFRPRRSVTPSAMPEQEVAQVKPLPGERTYLQAIESLTSAIEAGGQTSLQPALRAEYERDVAMLDHAIKSSRATARRNPNNPDAAEFLYSSYQSKVELLSAVAEQARLVPASR